MTRAINARYIRVRNTKALDLWWRIQDFSVETRSGNSELTDTNVESLKETPVVDSWQLRASNSSWNQTPCS